jgi:hypothetical protein
MRGTSKDVLWQIERWLMDERDRRVLWLNGLSGTGKSTISQTFAEMCFAGGGLGASFSATETSRTGEIFTRSSRRSPSDTAGPSRIEDAFTREEVFRLSGRYRKPTIARWDGRSLVAGYRSGEVLILDFDNALHHLQ